MSVKDCTSSSLPPASASRQDNDASHDLEGRVDLLRSSLPSLSTVPTNYEVIVRCPGIVREERVYFDDEFDTYYYIPPTNRELFDFAGEFQALGSYQKVCIAVKTKMKDPFLPGHPLRRCDVLSLVKQDRQVKYEETPFQEVALWHLRAQYEKWVMEDIILKQGQLGKKIVEELQEKMKTWPYETFYVCASTALLALGYSLEDARKKNLVILFYKESKKPTM
jgi:hypothetical protein